MKGTGLRRGQPITFRIPSNTPDYVLKYLQQLKERERRNFSSAIAEYVIKGVGQSYAKERDTITIPLPNSLSKVEKDWLKHEHSEALLGNIVYQLLTNPVRSTAVLSALMSNDQGLEGGLLPKGVNSEEFTDEKEWEERDQEISLQTDDDLDSFDWEKATKPEAKEANKTEESMESLLGDFLNQMNQ
ncbi:hypothetical protein WAK64_14810 [Bacillus spongiae]|uniref:Uncharacterized protein n=1 Tax=Bacillus spongiae TaxID=2683610 RepID=A0ABU8HGJ7_9BACI